MRRIALATTVLLMGSFVMAAPAGAAASIKIKPSTDLAAGDIVHVSGTGFTPDTTLASAQCKAGAVSTDNCDLGSSAFPNSDGSGGYSFNFTVHGALNTINGPVDCTSAPGACVIGVAESADILGTAVTAPISFTPLAPPHGGVLHGAPTAPIGANNSIDITGTGFVPTALVETAECAAGATSADDCDIASGVPADSAGAWEYYIFVSETLETLGGDSIDCKVAGACVFAAWDLRNFGASITTAALTVAPEVPGSLTVTPATGLHDNDEVTVTGSDWPADQFLEIGQCNGAQSITCASFASVFTDSAGEFSTPLAVRSVSNNFGQYLNCETTQCYIVANWYPEGSIITASAPIAFDVTPTPVTSHYTYAEFLALYSASSTLGVSNAEVQHIGAYALSWILAITGTGHITPAPDTGTSTLTTDWLPSEYGGMSALATAHDTTFPEYQKTGALLLAYVLALS